MQPRSGEIAQAARTLWPVGGQCDHHIQPEIERCRDTVSYQGLAAHRFQQLVAAAHPRRGPGGGQQDENPR
jgi:hypothetical protein